MKKKLLVTGGAGFIGSNFIRLILNKYPAYHIVNLDKLTYCGNPDNLKSISANPNYRFVQGDICDHKLLEEIMKDCEIVVNFAAETHVDRSIDNAAEFVRTNILGTEMLLDAARKCNLALFCQISTDETYGSREKGFFKESDALRPSSPYSASKAAADQLVYAYYVTYNLPIMIVRPTNNFGPYQYPEKIIPLFITNALKGKKLPVYGDGQNVRDWIYVLDNCAAIDFAIHRGKIGEIYNIAGNNEMKNIDLTRLILKIMKQPQELIEFVPDRPGHDRRYALDSSKIKRLGWKPGHNFEQVMEETVQWYHDNQQWWQPLLQ